MTAHTRDFAPRVGMFGLTSVILLLAVAACTASSDGTHPNVGGQIAVPTPLVNQPNLHWINRDTVCFVPGSDASIPVASAGGPVEVPATPAIVTCSTPQPTPGTEASAAASPLQVAQLRVPLTATGPQRIRLGSLSLPDGYYTATSFMLMNGSDGTFVVENLRVELDPLIAGRPPMRGSVATRPLMDGPEPFEAYLAFEVASFRPGAALDIADLFVH